MEKFINVCEWSIFIILLWGISCILFALIWKSKRLVCVIGDKILPENNSKSASEINSQYGIIGEFIDVIKQDLNTPICKGNEIDYIKKHIQLKGQELKIKASIDGYYSIEHKSDIDKKKKLDEILLEIIDFYMQMSAMSIISNNGNHPDKQKVVLLCTDLKNKLDQISGTDVIEIHRAIQGFISKHRNTGIEIIDNELNEQIKKIEAEAAKIN